MGKVLTFSCFLLSVLLFFLPVRAQPVATPVMTPFRLLSSPVYHPPSFYPVRQQRLLLQLSSTDLHVSYNAEIDLDTCLLHASRLLGLSRMSLIGEGFGKEIPVSDAFWIDRRDPAAAIRSLPGLRGLSRLDLLVKLGAYYVFQPRAWLVFKDSALMYLEAAREESRKLKESVRDRQVLCLMGKLYVEGNELRQGNAYFDEAVAGCDAAGDRATEAKAWAWRGLYTRYSAATTKDRINSLQKAQALYRENGDREGEINVLTNMGYLYVSAIELKKGEEAFKEALRLEDITGFPYTHYTTDNIAMATTFEGKYGEPLGFAFQSVKTAEILKDSVMWGSFYLRLAVLYGFLENKATDRVQWARKAFERFAQERDNGFLYNAMTSIVAGDLDRGEATGVLEWLREVARNHPPQSMTSQSIYHNLLTNCFLTMKMYDSAEAQMLEVARLDSAISLLRGDIGHSFMDSRIGQVYFEKGDYTKAKRYFQKYLSESLPGYNLMNNLLVHRNLATIDSAAGDYFSAMRHLDTYIHLQDSNFNVQGQRQSEELGVKYETEKKETEIQLRDQRIAMLQQADMLRQTRFRQAELVQRMTIGGIIVLLFIAGLLFRQNRQKVRMNKLIAQQNEIITRKNALLQQLLTEKEWLLKEVNHRVKNNLHTVISLLESQARNLKNEALEAIESSQHRIYAMSLIHQRIYQSGSNQTIEMAGYLREFIQYLRDSFGNPEGIRFDLEIHSFKLGLAQAVPIALIVNEAVTNSIKHAFPNGREGEITIRFLQEGKYVILSIADSGVGMGLSSDKAESGSLGIGLMRGLSEELRGEIFFLSDKGTTILVRFDAEQLIRVYSTEEKEAVL